MKSKQKIQTYLCRKILSVTILIIACYPEQCLLELPYEVEIVLNLLQ